MVDHDDDTDYMRLAKINDYAMFTTDVMMKLMRMDRMDILN